jgi:uncharacterized membrane protein
LLTRACNDAGGGVATSSEAVGRIAAIAVIRTFLNFFLERDLAEVRERRDPAGGEQ